MSPALPARAPHWALLALALGLLAGTTYRHGRRLDEIARVQDDVLAAAYGGVWRESVAFEVLRSDPRLGETLARITSARLAARAAEAAHVASPTATQ